MQDSLMATINLVRPDLVKETGLGVPIPNSPPAPKESKRKTESLNVAKFLTLAKDWNTSQDPTGWFELVKILC
jgi:hypothetical protein